MYDEVWSLTGEWTAHHSLNGSYRALLVCLEEVSAAMLAAAVTVAVELRSEKGRARLERLTAFFLRCSQRVIRRPKGEVQTVARAVLASVQRLQLGASALAQVLLWGLVNWWADVACLAFALRATGITGLSVGKILLIWTAGAGAASFSPTPGGHRRGGSGHGGGPGRRRG